MLLQILLVGSVCLPYYAVGEGEGSETNGQLLETIKSNMDLAVDPCENFYQYACGNWENQQGFPLENANFVDTIGWLEFTANKELADMLEERIAAGKGERDEVYRKVRLFYESCKEATLGEHVAELEAAYLELLKPGERLEWPTTDGTVPVANFNWLQTLGRLRAIGFNGVLIVEELKNRNATSYVAQLDVASNVDFDKWEQAQLALWSNSTRAAERMLAERLRQFKVKHKQLIVGLGSARTVNELTLAELQQRLPSVDFGAYFEQLLGAPLAPATHILVRHLTYFRKLSELVSKTRPDTLLHYIKLKLLGYLRTVQPRSPAPQHCVGCLRAHMSLALDYMYERERYQHVRNATDAVIVRIYQQMQAKFVELIDAHAAEYSDEELAFLKRKIRTMQLNIGNLPRAVSLRYYADYYAQVDFLPKQFHWNHLVLLQHANMREHYLLQLTQLPGAPEHTFFPWKYGSPAYDQSTNRLLIPFAYLRAPIFHRDYHELFLFAELGNTLGHEMMHGFDTLGLQYDANGTPSMLLVDAMQRKPHLQRSLACLKRVATANVNEKLADFSGFRLAFESYFHRATVPKLRLPASAWSNKQLFFVKFAQFFCAISPQRIAYDGSHDTPFERVPQAVANSAEFAKEFDCPADSKMRAEEQCDVW